MTASAKSKKTANNKKEFANTAPSFPVRKGQEMELDITGLGSTGEGVGRFKDIAVFVPGALPGETVKVSAEFICILFFLVAHISSACRKFT